MLRCKGGTLAKCEGCEGEDHGLTSCWRVKQAAAESTRH